MANQITIKGARQNNLKNIDIIIPRDKLVVFTGLSGSGKSSLAIDTIYAEGQRRYMESLNSYARQFLGSMDKPDLDYIDGLSPAIAIEQKVMSANPRSTVGTVTEIYDYLRLLYANIGIPHCPNCHREILPQTTDEISDHIFTNLLEDTKFRVLAPIIQHRKGEYSAVFKQLKKDGFVRIIVDKNEYELDEEIHLDKNKFHDIDVVIDRLVLHKTDDFRTRLADAIEQASRLTKGLVKIWEVEKEPIIFSESLFCPECGISMPEMKPQLFSFNIPLGFCPNCNGLGFILEFTEERLFPDKDQNIFEQKIREVGGFGTINSYTWAIIQSVAQYLKLDLYQPIKNISEEHWKILMYGSGTTPIPIKIDATQIEGKDETFAFSVNRPYEGIITTLQRRYKQTASEAGREYYEQWMDEYRCPVCKGRRLRAEALGVTIHEKNIADLAEMTVDTAINFIKTVEQGLTERQRNIVKEVLKELYSRYNFLKSVGLEYITMDRQAKTLSGGESERVRLATQIGSNLVGVLYVLDEPTIGLHPRDKGKLIGMLKQLRDKGNSILVVEHDEDVIRAADYIIDIGPGAGIHGGKVVATGTIPEIEQCHESLTGQYLCGERFIPVPGIRRTKWHDWITVSGAREHNLKNITVKFPMGTLTIVTGVSGAGKSSLVMECLYKGLHKQIYRGSREMPGDFDSIEGAEYIDKIIHIDQQPIGRTPRSIPATYSKIFDKIRDLYETLPESKLRGYKKGRFSFNVRGGRCEKCQGSGYILIEMQFLPDVFIKCDVCKGKRYNNETLEVKFKGKSIADVLDMSHEEAFNFFENFPALRAILKTVIDTGLGYIKLGQSSTQLSGGEAQRIKLSRELSKRSTGNTLYILDEPTTGLHFHDTLQLLIVLQRLVDQGNTVIIIEHSMDVIKTSDYLIDMGPEGGDQGGNVIAMGTPEDVAKNPKSYTGQYLKTEFANAKTKNQYEFIEERKKLPIPKKPISQLSRKPWATEENGNNNGNDAEIDNSEGHDPETIPESNTTLPEKKITSNTDRTKKSKKKSKSKIIDEE